VIPAVFDLVGPRPHKHRDAAEQTAVTRIVAGIVNLNLTILRIHKAPRDSRASETSRMDPRVVVSSTAT